MPRLKAANNARSTLAAAIDAVQTSLTVTDASLFPDPPFRITVDAEIMEVGTINRSTNTFSSVTRGVEGTAAAAHAQGASVENRFTAGTLAELADKAQDVDPKFNGSTGHKHSGAAGDAPKLPLSSLDTDVATQAELDTAMTNHLAAADPHPNYALDSDLSAHKNASTLDHPAGSVGLTHINSAAKTTAGGTEANRLAVTNASGRVGDAEKLGGLGAAAFMRTSKVYGNAAYTDSIAAGSTLQKTIPLGGSYQHGIAVVERAVDFLGLGIVVFFGTNNLKTKAAGYKYVDGGAGCREHLGGVTSGEFGKAVCGVNPIYINEFYISGTNLVIIFYNPGTSAQSLTCRVDWEVW